MNRNQQPALALFVIGLLGLGVLALHYRDFALVWQPVPAWVPARAAVAYSTGVLTIALGIGLLIPRTRPWSVRILFPYLALWASLKLRDVVTAPGTEASWLGLGELTLLLSGGWTLFAALGQVAEASPTGLLTGGRGLRAARYLFGVSIIPIGLSHLVYLQVTAGYVPAWLPFRNGWAILTGAGQIASGLGVLFSVLPRIAAYAEAAQIMIYTFLVRTSGGTHPPERHRLLHLLDFRRRSLDRRPKRSRKTLARRLFDFLGAGMPANCLVSQPRSVSLGSEHNLWSRWNNSACLCAQSLALCHPGSSADI
jgi:uncharacterized membrane protein